MKAFKDQSPSTKDKESTAEINNIKVEDSKEKVDVVPGVVTTIISPDKQIKVPSKRLAETAKEEKSPSESAQSRESSLSPPPPLLPPQLPPPQTRRSTRSSRKKKKVNFSKDSDSEIN